MNETMMQRLEQRQADLLGKFGWLSIDSTLDSASFLLG
jgi:hypothetical protein